MVCSDISPHSYPSSWLACHCPSHQPIAQICTLCSWATLAADPCHGRSWAGHKHLSRLQATLRSALRGKLPSDGQLSAAVRQCSRFCCTSGLLFNALTPRQRTTPLCLTPPASTYSPHHANSEAGSPHACAAALPMLHQRTFRMINLPKKKVWGRMLSLGRASQRDVLAPKLPEAGEGNQGQARQQGCGCAPEEAADVARALRGGDVRQAACHAVAVRQDDACRMHAQSVD